MNLPRQWLITNTSSPAILKRLLSGKSAGRKHRLRPFASNCINSLTQTPDFLILVGMIARHSINPIINHLIVHEVGQQVVALYNNSVHAKSGLRAVFSACKITVRTR